MTRPEIRRAIAKWKKLLWCGQWDFNSRYVRLEDSRTLAQTKVEHEYLQATFEFPMDRLEELMEKEIVHEIVHVVLAPLSYPAMEVLAKSNSEKEWMRGQVEIVTSKLTRILCAMQKVDWEAPRRKSVKSKKAHRKNKHPKKGV